MTTPNTNEIDSQLALRPAQDLAKASIEPSVGQMLQAVIEKGVTPENVTVMGELVKLYERMQDRNAEQEFNRAFVALQAEMPNVRAVKPVPNNDGTVRYRFAPYEEIMEQVAPLLKANGFTVSFSTDYTDGRIVKMCRLSHVNGHSRENKFAVRVGKGPPGSTETQADGAAGTYAKRGALCDALNIVIDHDCDARMEGGVITQEQVEELARRVSETESNRAAFLKFAGASRFEEIPAARYAVLDEFLAKKERRGR